MEGQTNLGFVNGSEDIHLDDVSKSKTNSTTVFPIRASKRDIYIKLLLKTAFHIGVLVHFIFATNFYIENYENGISWCDGYGFLLVLLFIFYGVIVYDLSVKYLHAQLKCCIVTPLSLCVQTLRKIRFFPQILIAVAFTAIVIFLVLDTQGQRHRLKSTIGLAFFLLIGLVFSKHPIRKIKWRPVATGLFLQFVFGLLTIRWSVGRHIFQCLGDKVSTFLNYGLEGSAFIYGELLAKGSKDFPQVFAFSVLPIIFFLSFCVSILYYYGVMQSIVTRMGWGLGNVLGTTICESVNSAANIFLGMTEAPLLLKPYLQNLTRSEMHAIMTSGFATVSGTVFAAYISFGAQASHLITASVMSAPAALCFSKLIYPETEESKSTLETIALEESEDTSVMDAASKGASQGTALVLGIIANIIAFVAFVAFLDGSIEWLGKVAGRTNPDEYINFQWIIGHIFMPLSWIMGVDWDECEYVGNLIATKTVVNEFAAYQKMGEYKDAGLLTPRAEMIATYAVCGFANPSSLGIMIGGMSILVPDSRETITEISVRALMSGAIVCFMTACIAGMLVDGEEFVNT